MLEYDLATALAERVRVNSTCKDGNGTDTDLNECLIHNPARGISLPHSIRSGYPAHALLFVVRLRVPATTVHTHVG